MIICKNIRSLQRKLETYKSSNKQISLVPTMGALHQGHLSLVKNARRKKGIVVVSIYVNPKQFGPNEDYKNYPRNISADIELLKRLSVDIVFIPRKKGILNYNISHITYPKLRLEKIMCGKTRTKYFSGVGSIVIKLFDIVKPNYAYFGEKDFQQYYYIKLITEKSKIEIKIISGKTVRDKSGLALSSRNLYLSKKEIKLAVNIIKVLRKTKKELIKNFSPREIININKKVLINRGVSKIDYFELRSEQLKSRIKKGEKSRLFIAAFIGSTRLIDNLKVY